MKQYLVSLIIIVLISPFIFCYGEGKNSKEDLPPISKFLGSNADSLYPLVTELKISDENIKLLSLPNDLEPYYWFRFLYDGYIIDVGANCSTPDEQSQCRYRPKGSVKATDLKMFYPIYLYRIYRNNKLVSASYISQSDKNNWVYEKMISIPVGTPLSEIQNVFVLKNYTYIEPGGATIHPYGYVEYEFDEFRLRIYMEYPGMPDPDEPYHEIDVAPLRYIGFFTVWLKKD